MSAECKTLLNVGNHENLVKKDRINRIKRRDVGLKEVIYKIGQICKWSRNEPTYLER
jgi:hypothetical protein